MQNDANECGRSMTEMLGVLAVIGVLSIGGIQGYTYAMNKYRANNVLNEINMASHDIAVKLLTSRNATKRITLGAPYDNGTMTTENYPFVYGCGNYDRLEKNCHQDETGYWVTIGDVPEKICQNLLSETEKLPFLVQKKRNGVVVTDGSDCDETNEIMFLFNADGSDELAKDCGSITEEKPEEPTQIDSCPENTTQDGQGGFAISFTDKETGKLLKCYCAQINTKYTEAGNCETLPEMCSSNADCNRGDYCDIEDYGSDSCTRDTSGMTGNCRTSSSDVKKPKSGKNPPFTMSNKTMKWWSAKNFCEALNKTMVEVSDYGCEKSYGSGTGSGHCYTAGTTSKTANVQAMQGAYGTTELSWTNTDYSSCNVHCLNFYRGNVTNHEKNSNSYAICK